MLPQFWFFSLLFWVSAAVADPSLNNLSQSEVDGVSKDFSALLSHTTVSPASGLIKKGGFEFGLMAGTSSIPNIQRGLAQRDPSTTTPSKMPNAGLIGIFSFAKNLTLELKIIPEIASEKMYLGSQSAALKFTFHDWFEDPAVVTSFRLQLTNSYIKNEQKISDATSGLEVDGQTKFTSLSYGVASLLGYRMILSEIFLVEPFIGGGVLQANSRYEIFADVPTTMFSSGSTSMTSSLPGLMFMLGVQAHSFYSKLGLEYSRVFDSDRVTFKLSFGY